MKDLWLWDLDWTVNQYKLNKAKPPTKAEKQRLKELALQRKEESVEETEEERIQKVLATAERVPKIWQHMPEYPK